MYAPSNEGARLVHTVFLWDFYYPNVIVKVVLCSLTPVSSFYDFSMAPWHPLKIGWDDGEVKSQMKWRVQEMGGGGE